MKPFLNNFYKQERTASATVRMDFFLQPDFYSEPISVSGLELLQFSFDSKTRNMARNLALTIIICKKTTHTTL